MDQMGNVKRSQRQRLRLQEIAKELGVILDADLTTLYPPLTAPSFQVADDERKADAILRNLHIEEAVSKPQARGLKRLSTTFQKPSRSAAYTYDELYAALSRVVEENGEVGVVEVLLKRFQDVQGNINLSRRASTGVIKRMRNADSPEERGRLLQTATESARLEIVQLLSPLADQSSLDESLHIALGKRELPIVETLLRYGGNLALSKAFFLDVANNGDSEFIRILLRARRRVSAECVTQALLPAVTSGSLPSVLLLVQAGADGSFDNASALTQAVSDNRVDLTAALILGQYPPDGSSVDQSLASVFQTPFTTLNTRYRLIEVLLCGCPSGSAANNALLQVTLLFNVRMMILLLAHGADINHNGASAVGHAIQRNRADLVAILLQDQSLMPDVASGLVKQIPPNAPSTDKLAVLSKLLVNGASGVHCSEMLIAAAEQNDLDIAELLVSYHRGDDSRPPVCSVDYNAARCLQVAVARNSLPMVKLLALEGAPLKFSLAKAFSSIPSKLSKDDHFLLVQTLLRAGAAGPEVEAAFLAAVSAQHKSTRLIEVFVHFGANINEQTLLAAVTQGNVEILKVLLSGNVPAATCSAAIPPAMKIRNLGGRFKTVRQLIGPATASGLEVAEISQAVIDIIQSTPDDLPLLSLLCREGKANVNFSDGLVVSEAVKQADARVLEIVLHGQGSSPSPATIDQALKQAIGLPSSDSSRERKVEFLLRRAKPQTGINEALIREIKSASESQSNISVIRLLLEAGADVNASEGGKEAAPICWAVTRNVPELLDLILSKQPLARSLSLALPLAMTFQDPARYNLCEKLLRTGAVGDEVSKALCKAAKEGAASLPLLQLLLPQADVNFKDGLPLRIAVRHGFFELVDLLLAPRPVKPSSVAKAGAFQEAMKLKSKNDRHKMVDKLLKAGMGTQVASEALLSAVNAADIELVKVLLKSGASVEHRGGIAIRSAASCGETAILKTLVDGELCSKPTLSTLTGGFGGALTIKDTDKDAYHLVIQTLLNAGMRGEAVDEALIHAVQEGDSNIRFCELLYDSASVEWKEGEAVNIAVQIFAIKSLALLLRKQPTENTLKRAYRSTLQLPKEQRYQTIELILKAGKAIDKHVAKTLTTAAMETPSDRRLITLLLSHGVFDEGEAIVHTAGSLDLRTLTLLLGSPKANGCLADAFKEAMKTDLLWKSSTGLAIMKLMLKKGGASGEAVGEALYQAIEKSEAAPEGLASEFLDVLLESGADVNYQRGLALQRAAMQVNIPLLEKLLPSANSESKAMAIPYIFICCDDRAVVLKAIQMFERSFVEGDPGVDITFTHPDTNLEPLLFMALDRFPRDTTILEALLQMGYHANQWQLCEDTDVGMEPWPILFWALDRPEKKISSATIELLIDEGANINFKSKSGMTPLILAIHNQRPDIVARLIRKGANVSIPDPDGTSPLALASRVGSTPMMELLLEGDAVCDDGSLHDAARELRSDSMRVLIKYGHQADYPSDRHEGRSALAELSLKAVNCQPDPAKLQEAIECLVANESDIRLRTSSENDSGRTILHYALDSSDPVAILKVLLKMMWKVINEDCFLYSDKTHTYSLTKYVEKGVYQGPREQKDDILALLRNKRAVDRYWANSIDDPQPADYCNAPKYIEEEVLLQRARQKRKLEQRQDVRDHLDLKRITVQGEVQIMEIQTEADIKRGRETAAVERELLIMKAKTQLRLEMDAERERDRLTSAKQIRDVNHQKALGDVQVTTQRTIRQEAFEEDRSRNVMQIEYIGKKIGIENEGTRARLAIEGNAMHESDRILNRQHERELARIKMQKTLVDKNMSLASSLQNTGMNQRQIGYITGEVS